MMIRIVALCVVLAQLPVSALAKDAGDARSGRPPDSVLVSFEGPWALSGPAQPLTTRDGKAPPLRPAAQKIYAAHMAERKQGKNGFDPLARCLPPGIPRLYSQAGMFRLSVGDRLAGMFFETQHLFRVITLRKDHFEAIGPGYQGQAVAHWQGTTLVVDSNQFNDVTLLDDAGMPHSDELHVVERISVAGDGKLHIAMTISDPKTFTRSFTSELVFEKRPGQLLGEDYCLQRTGLLAKS